MSTFARTRVTSAPALTPRVAALRERLSGLPQVWEGVWQAFPVERPYLGDEPFHRAWLANLPAPFPVRLAAAQAAWRAAVQPELCPGQLFLGTPPPRTVISYPTGVFAWDFQLDEALASAHPETEAIAAYWRQWLTDRPPPDLPEGAQVPELRDSLWIAGISCHSTQAYDLVLEEGLDGLRRRIVEGEAVHAEARDWFRALAVAVEGVAGYVRAHAEAAERAALTAAAAQAAEWRLLAANCRHLTHGAPATFLQAAQLCYFLFMLNGHDSPGRLDQYLWPGLRRDLEARALTLESAQEIVDCLYLKLAEHVCYGATLGGQLPEGGDATNPLTWLCLHSIRRLRLLSPRTALRWHRGTPDELFAGTIRSLVEGVTFPTLVNDEVMVPSMLRRGAREEHARDYTFCGCGQTIPSGRAYGGYEDLMLNAAKPLTYALHEGRDERTGAVVGARTPPVEELADFEAVEAAVWAQCEHLLTVGIEATNACRRWGAEHVPDALRSLLTHSCLERGLDWRAGGADYHEGMVDVVGLTTLADSLTALRRWVFVEGRLTLAEFVRLLDEDWAGAEHVRLDCLHRTPKFGNENPEADETVGRWLRRFNDWLFGQRTAFGGPWGMDVIGWSGAVAMGAVTGATPDGRRAGEPLADCAGPAQGRDRSGVTAVLNSMLTLPMSEVHGPLALSLLLPESAVNTPAGEAKLAALARTYLERGGQQLQISIADAETLRAAQREPEHYRNLIVRVGGFSARFVDLDTAFQDEMISRTAHAL